ncbi:MAG: relaxase/mobilization nuclease domain-containing protein [Actinobacteria bacterium]|nr:relaxase/mobilization nuclease domain-containing protein [Actinomycetota bacterium]
MNATKNLYEKTRGLQYHHIIQSFKPDEVDPGKAHALGYSTSRGSALELF